MKNKIKWLKRPMHLALTLLVIAILGIGTTIAFFTDIEAAVNRITTGRVEIETNEEVHDLTKSNIAVTATGKSKCYVRIRVDIPTVKYKIGDKTYQARIKTIQNREYNADQFYEFKELPATGSVSGVMATGLEWKKSGDYWYCPYQLGTNDNATILKEITFPGLWDEETGTLVNPLPDGLTMDMLTIPIVSEAVQAEGIDVGNAQWADAAIKAFEIVNGQ